MITLNLTLPNTHYPIHIGERLLDHTELLRSAITGSKVAIVTNEVVAPLYLSQLSNALQTEHLSVVPIILPDGEVYKDWQTLNRIFDVLLTEHCERNTTLIALGGGVIGDITGFAAACYQRGVAFIQIPTTLLAQVDSSVGGKTAINHPLGKNMIGAFYQPRVVIADISLLDTLPDRELSAGLAEVIKYGLLGDATFFTWLEEHIGALRARDRSALQYAVQHCCAMKADIVRQDEKESGIRALLNLGHTFGHAIEAGLGFGVWLHGEAVAAGMVLAATTSHALGWLQDSELARIRTLIKAAGLPTQAPDLGVEQWLSLMSHDKKVREGKIRMVLLQQIGHAMIVDTLPPNILHNVLSSPDFCQ